MSQEEIVENGVKRQRTLGPDNVILDSIRADAVIRLQFMSSNKTHTVIPEYTHQIFDNEVIPSYGHNHEGKVAININCGDLSHDVRLPDSLTADEKRSLITNLSKALPVETALCTDENCNTNMPSTVPLLPPGHILRSFQSSSQNFEIYRATAKDTGAQELLHRAEKIAMWFIETADSVDFTDERWEVLFMYATKNTESSDASQPNTTVATAKQREFVGYVTLFSFRNPIFGTKVRVCQALILPHWQGRSLGRELLLSVYDCVVYARDEVSELTVEDPCPGFQRLRDSVDLELLLRQYPNVATEQGAMPSEVEVAKTLKVIKSQAQFLGECLDFFALVRELLLANAAKISSSSTGTDSLSVVACSGTVPSIKALEAVDGFKTFRLKVKKRIVKNDKDLASLQPKSAMQQALSEEFAVEFKRFLALQKTAVRLKVIPSCLQ